MILTKHAALAALAGLALATGSANGALVVYEGFDYSTGSVVGQNGGSGFDGSWQAGSDNSNQWAVQSPGLTFSGLDTVGGSIKRPSAPNGADINRAISSSAQAALTTVNTTIWFSFLTVSTTFSIGNANGALLFGTGGITSMADGGAAVQMAGGSAFGFSYRGLTADGGSMRLHAMTINNGTSTRSDDFIFDTTATTYMIVGRIDWAPNGQNDVLSLFNVTDPTAGLPLTPFATMSADLDQSLFNTIAIGTRQVETFDEIRFGTTMESVGLIPEPTTALLGSLGMLCLLRRRRN
ncbi:MAG: hypothetical protein ACNA8L_03755 [Luteolibacter sp.]